MCVCVNVCVCECVCVNVCGKHFVSELYPKSLKGLFKQDTALRMAIGTL